VQSHTSQRVVEDYVARRGVEHVIEVSCPDSAVQPDLDETIEIAGNLRQLLDDAGAPFSPIPLMAEILRRSETVDVATYRSGIEAPVRGYVAERPEIDILVTTKGVPLRVNGIPAATGGMRYSLDGLLTVLGYDELPDSMPVAFGGGTLDMFFSTTEATAWVNRFWNSERRFSHREFGGYLVSRLDGYTVDDAIALTTRALEAEARADAGGRPDAPILLQPAPDLGRTTKAWTPFTEYAEDGPVLITAEAPLGEFNADLDDTAILLRDRGIPVTHIDGGDPLHAGEFSGYASFGSNDPRYDAAAYNALRFVPGAIAETAVSTSARSLQRIDSAGGQSLIGHLVSQGITAVRGYTDEPLLQAVASPRIMFERYTRGWTAVESFAAASGIVGWQETLLGDPLARAYPTASGR
jgi:hypothetical protein